MAARGWPFFNLNSASGILSNYESRRRKDSEDETFYDASEGKKISNNSTRLNVGQFHWFGNNDNTKKLTALTPTPVKIRLSKPNTSFLGLSDSSLDNSRDDSTRNVIQALRQYSQKRTLQNQEDDQESKRVKNDHHNLYISQDVENAENTKTNNDDVKNYEEFRNGKRVRNPADVGGPVPKRKNNEILSSLSSSVGLLEPNMMYLMPVQQRKKKKKVKEKIDTIDEETQVETQTKDECIETDKRPTRYIQREKTPTKPKTPEPVVETPRKRSPIREREVTEEGAKLILMSAVKKFAHVYPNMAPIPKPGLMDVPVIAAPAVSKPESPGLSGFHLSNVAELAKKAETSSAPVVAPFSHQETPKPSFQFGSDAAKTTTTSASLSFPTAVITTAGFSFGTTTTSDVSPKMTTFAFGKSTEEKTPEVPKTQNTKEPPKFMFGSNAPTSEPAKFNATTTSPIKFGATIPLTATASSTFGSTTTSAPPVFGATTEAPKFGIAPTSEPPKFGTSSMQSPKLGATTNSLPTFGSTTTTALPTFGSTTTAPTFGATTTAPPTFGATTTAPPIFGSTTTAPTFGATSTAPPTFGATTTAPPTFGAATTTAPPTFGAVTTTAPPMFGAATTTAPPAFGATSTAPPTFGAATTTAPPAFGATTTAPPTFGAATTTAPPMFGGTSSSTFGATSTAPPTFGATTTAPSMFGATTTAPSVFGAKTTAPTTFGSTSTAPTFGSGLNPPVFGSSTSTPPTFGASTVSPVKFGATDPPKFGASQNQPLKFGTNVAEPIKFGAEQNKSVFGGAATSEAPKRVFGATEPPKFGSDDKDVSKNVFALGSNDAVKRAPKETEHKVDYFFSDKRVKERAEKAAYKFSYGDKSPSNSSATNILFRTENPSPTPSPKPAALPPVPTFGVANTFTKNFSNSPSFQTPAPPFGQSPGSFGSNFTPSTTPSFGSNNTPSFGSTFTNPPSFGAPNNNTQAPFAFGQTTPSPSFNFNAQNTQQQQQPQQSGMFQFGASSQNTTTSSQPFSFNAPGGGSSFQTGGFNFPAAGAQMFNIGSGNTSARSRHTRSRKK